MIRAAKAADTMAVIGLMQEAKAKSRYADIGEVDVKLAKLFLGRMVHFQGNRHAGGSLYVVSETDGALKGFFLAHLAPVYIVGNKLEAQDLHLYMSDDADPRDFFRCIALFDEWAASNPDVIEATLSLSDFIPDPEGAELIERIYARRGYERTASVHKRRIPR